MTSGEFIFLCAIIFGVIYVYNSIQKRKEERELMEDDDDE